MHIFTEILVYTLVVLWHPRSYREDTAETLKGNVQARGCSVYVYLLGSLLLVPLGVLLFGSDLETSAPRIASYILYVLLVALNKGWVWIFFSPGDAYARSTATLLVVCIGILSGTVSSIVFAYELGIGPLALGVLYTMWCVYLTYVTTTRCTTSQQPPSHIEQYHSTAAGGGMQSRMRAPPPPSGQYPKTTTTKQPLAPTKRQLVISF